MSLKLIAVLAVLNLPIYAEWARMFFGGKGGFWDSLTHFFMPDVISLFRGEYWEDRFNTTMIYIWIFACGFTVAAEHHVIKTYLPGVFAWFE